MNKETVRPKKHSFFFCPECGEDLYECERCGKKIDESVDVICDMDDNTHYHAGCVKIKPKQGSEQEHG